MRIRISCYVMYTMQSARNYRSVAQTIKRLEEAAVSYRGPERVQLLRRWVVVLHEIQKLSEASLAEGKEKTLEQQLAVEDAKENPKRPSLVRIINLHFSYVPFFTLLMTSKVLFSFRRFSYLFCFG